MILLGAIIFASCLTLIIIFKSRSRSSFITNIESRRVFITGCDSGFGRSLALRLDDMGISVYAGCLLDESSYELKKLASSKLQPIIIDISKEESVRQAAKKIEDDLGGKELWAVVNNASISLFHLSIDWLQRADVKRVMDINVLGTFDVTHTFLPLLRVGKAGGRIINISSMAGLLSNSTNPYTMSKYAMEAFSNGLSYEVEKYGLTVHTIQPTVFKTNINKFAYDHEDFLRRHEQVHGDVRHEFTAELLKNKIENFHRAIDGFSNDITPVVDVCVDAVLSARPKNRYKVGQRANAIKLVSLLPFSVQMWLIKKFWKT